MTLFCRNFILDDLLLHDYRMTIFATVVFNPEPECLKTRPPMNMVRLSALLIFLIFVSSVESQTPRTASSVTVADGLSQGFVTSLFQDSRGFIWIGSLYGLNRYDGYEIKSYTPDLTAPHALRASTIYNICEGPGGVIWLGTEKGIIAFDPYSERFLPLNDAKSNIPGGSANQVYIRKNGSLVVQNGDKNVIFEVTPPKNLMNMIRSGVIESGSFKCRVLQYDNSVNQPVYKIRLSADSTLLAFDAGGNLCKANLDNMVCKSAAPGDFSFRQIASYGLIDGSDGSGHLFHLSKVNSRGLHYRFLPVYYNAGDKRYLYRWGTSDVAELAILPHHSAIPETGNPVFLRQFKPVLTLEKPCSGAILYDRSGKLWIGTNGYGARVLGTPKDGILHFADEISFSNFTCLQNGLIWPGQSHNIVFNTETGRTETVPWDKTLPSHANVNSLHLDEQGNYWALISLPGKYQFQKYNTETGRWSVLPFPTGRITGERTVITGDKKGYVWFLAGDARVIRVNTVDDSVEEWNIAYLFPPEETGQFQGYSSSDDGHNNLWIGTSCGLLRIDYSGDKPAFQAFHNFTPKGILFTSDHLLSVCPDLTDRNIIWVGTKGGGLCRLDIKKGTTDTYTTSDGLADNVIYGILPDVTGKLWLSTNRGITCHDPATRRFFNPFPGQPDLNVEFNTGAYSLLDSGKLALGSVNGLFIIDPLKLTDEVGEIRVAISDLRIRGVSISAPENASFVSFSETNEYRIDVPYSHNNISVSFVALPENSEKSVRYRYRITTLGSEWIETRAKRTVNIAGITYGNHTIEIQAAAQNAEWSESTFVHLRIRTPWYATSIAWITYTALVLAGIHLYIRRHRRQLELKHSMELDRMELERMKTMDQFKARFYSYITHEFKTPLTILLNLTGRISAENTRVALSSIKAGITRQAENMLELVNQVMDVSRLQDNNPELHWRQGDIGSYINLWVESFRPLADFKHISLEYTTDTSGMMMDFDPIRLKYIINNLLSNAIRHTGKGGKIEVSFNQCEDSRVCLTVTDNGEGIRPEDIPFIFDRNFRGKSDNREDGHFGLGLAFVKDLVFLFGGDISVTSEPGIGTRFTIFLPVSNTAPVMESAAPESEPAQEFPVRQTVEKGEQPLLLVVDDSQVILSYLKSFLSGHFRVITATNGKIAWNLALEHLPDLVLTDLVMPEMDGLQLTDKLKAHELTCHIPVLMLSARAEVEDRIKGHQHGADAFLPKPFHEQELELIVQNMLLLQKRWRERFQSFEADNNDQDRETTAPPETHFHHDPFMNRLYSVYEKHYAEENFDLDTLCQYLLISKSQLQRKLAAVVRESAMELLREFRLNKARELFLGYPDMQVKEVCTKTGFKNPAHFSTLFTKRFGISPSELRKQHED